MLNRKLLTLLRGFEPIEWKRLHKFLLSPYFNDAYNAEAITRLFEHIRKHKAQEDKPQLLRKQTFKYVFSDKVYTEGDLELDRLMSDLLKLIKTFLVQEGYRQGANTELHETLALAKYYGRIGLPDLFDRSIEQSRKMLTKKVIKDSEFHLDAFMLEREVVEFSSLSDTLKGDSNLLVTHEHLDLFYAISKMELACALKFRQSLTSVEPRFSFSLSEKIVEMIEKGTLDNPILRGYFGIFHILSNPIDEADILKLEAILVEVKSTIPHNKYLQMQTYVRSFWAKLSRIFRDTEHSDKLFEVYKKHLEAGYLYRNNQIQPMTLSNCITLALRAKQLAWAEKVLNDHPPTKIQDFEQSVEVYNLNVANFYFHKKQYDMAEKLLTFTFDNVYYAINANIILIKIYFETHFPIIDDKIAAFRVKVSRSAIPTERKQILYNFLNRLSKIIELRHSKDTTKKAKLLEEIKIQNNIVEKEWLIEKCS